MRWSAGGVAVFYMMLPLMAGNVMAQMPLGASPVTVSEEVPFQPTMLIEGLIEAGYIGRSEPPEGAPSREFRIKESQLGIGGKVFPRVSYYLEANFSEPDERVLLNDAVFTYEIAPWLSFAVGQIRVPLNRPAVSNKGSIFLFEPPSAGPQQAKARDRGANLIFRLLDGRVLYEQAITNGEGIGRGTTGNPDDNLLVQGRLLYFVPAPWPVPLPQQTDLQGSPWHTYLKAGWAVGRSNRFLIAENLPEEAGEFTWNIGQAVIGRGFYGFWQVGRSEAEGTRDFGAWSATLTTGYYFGLTHALHLEPKLQYLRLWRDDETLPDGSPTEVVRAGVNVYPFQPIDRLRLTRLMIEYEWQRDPVEAKAIYLFLHYAFAQ